MQTLSPTLRLVLVAGRGGGKTPFPYVRRLRVSLFFLLPPQVFVVPPWEDSFDVQEGRVALRGKKLRGGKGIIWGKKNL